MASLGEVRQVVELGLGKAADAIAALEAAADLVDGAQALIRAASRGSGRADVHQTDTTFTEVVSGILELRGRLEQVRAAYLTYFEDAAPGRASRAPTAAPRGGSVQPAQGSPEHIDQLRRELPHRPESASGVKTHGRWFANGTVRAIVSGRDADSRAVDKILHDELGLPANRPLARTADVEQKIAAHMRIHGIRHATVIINNTPCRGMFSCDTIVPVLLPEGSTLTVHGTNGYRTTFTGGAKPPWKR